MHSTQEIARSLGFQPPAADHDPEPPEPEMDESEPPEPEDDGPEPPEPAAPMTKDDIRWGQGGARPAAAASGHQSAFLGSTPPPPTTSDTLTGAPLIPTEVEVPGAALITTEANDLAAQATALQVTDADSYRTGVEFYDLLKAVEKRVDELLGPHIEAANKLHKGLTGLKNRMLERVLQAKQLVSTRTADWAREQQRIAEEKRRELERQAKQAEEDRLKKEADAARQSGDENTAKQIEQEIETLPTPAVAVQSAVPQVAGATARETWEAEVVDMQEFLHAIYKGTIPVAAITVNKAFLNTQARALKDELKRRYPGVIARRKTSLATRRT